MVSECSSLSIGIPASVVVGIGCMSVMGYLSVLDGTKCWMGQLVEVTHSRRQKLWRPVLVDVGHRHQATIEHFGNPDDQSSKNATHVLSLFRIRAALSAACHVDARLR